MAAPITFLVWREKRGWLLNLLFPTQLQREDCQSASIQQKGTSNIFWVRHSEPKSPIPDSISITANGRWSMKVGETSSLTGRYQHWRISAPKKKKKLQTFDGTGPSTFAPLFTWHPLNSVNSPWLALHRWQGAPNFRIVADCLDQSRLKQQWCPWGWGDILCPLGPLKVEGNPTLHSVIWYDISFHQNSEFQHNAYFMHHYWEFSILRQQQVYANITSRPHQKYAKKTPLTLASKTKVKTKAHHLCQITTPNG